MAPACWALCSNSDHVKHSAVSMKYPNLYSFVCLFLGEALPATSHPRRKGLGKSEHNSSSTARCNHNETSFIHMKTPLCCYQFHCAIKESKYCPAF